MRYEVAQGNTEDEVAVIVSAWRAECAKVGVERNRFFEVLKGLKEKRAVAVDGELARPLKVRP